VTATQDVAQLNSASLGTTFEVMGAVMPGSRLEHFMRLARREISHLQSNDFAIIWGGANDINRNESNISLRHIRKFALRNKHTNVIEMTPPNRYDLQDSSFVNKVIQVFNMKLHKLLKDMHHVSIIDMNVTKNEFTLHISYLYYFMSIYSPSVDLNRYGISHTTYEKVQNICHNTTNKLALIHKINKKIIKI